MGRKTINVKPTGFNEYYNVTIESLTSCAKIVSGNQLVTSMTLNNITAAQTPFQIDFGTCSGDANIKVTVTDKLGCQMVLNETVVNPFKVVCDDIEDLGLSFGFRTVEYDHHAGLDPVLNAFTIAGLKNAEYIEYYASKVGTFLNPTNVVSDVLAYSLDNGVTWTNGNNVERYRAFNTFAKVYPLCYAELFTSGSYSRAKNYVGTQIFTGLLNGNGTNFNPTGVNQHVVSGDAFSPLLQTITMGPGGYNGWHQTNKYDEFNQPPAPQDDSLTSWINSGQETLSVTLNFDDGYILNHDFYFICPYTDRTDAPTCDGVIPDETPIIRAGSQKDFKFRRIVTFNNGCPPIEIIYDINIVDIPNDQTVPFIEATRQ